MSTEKSEFIDLNSLPTMARLEAHFEIVGDTFKVIIDDHNAKVTSQFAFPLGEVLASVPLNVLTAHLLSRRVR